MRIHTDATIRISLDGLDLTGMTYRVSIVCGSTKILKASKDCTLTTKETGCEVVAPLTVDETDSLELGHPCHVQINFLDNAGKRHATNIACFWVDKNQDREAL